MMANLFNKFCLLACLALSALCVLSFHQVDELVQSDLETRKNIQELSAAYDSIIVSIERGEADKEQLVDIFESIKESDIAEYEYLEALSESLTTQKQLIFYILLIQAVFIFAIWRNT